MLWFYYKNVEFKERTCYLKQLNNRFSALIVSKYINTEITKIKGTSVLLVECKTSDEIIYLTDNQGNDLVYVRTGPRIDLLSTKEVVELSKTKIH